MLIFNIIGNDNDNDDDGYYLVENIGDLQSPTVDNDNDNGDDQ